MYFKIITFTIIVTDNIMWKDEILMIMHIF